MWLRLRLISVAAEESVAEEELGPGRTKVLEKKAEIVKELNIIDTIIGDEYKGNDDFYEWLASEMRKAGCSKL